MIFRRFLQRFQQQPWGSIATEPVIVIILVWPHSASAQASPVYAGTRGNTVDRITVSGLLPSADRRVVACSQQGEIMKKMLLIGAGLLLLTTTAWAQSRGDWVLARWQGGQYYYPGVVESSSGSKVTVAYDDGARETLSAKKVRAYTWVVGSRVECDWKGAGTWYAAKIIKINAKDGARIKVRYDVDDWSENTRTGKCRSR